MKNLGNDFNVVQEILDKTEEELEKMSPINILIAGKTGVGKSTLINSVFREKLATTGIGKPVTPHLRRISKKGVPVVLYDTRGLELEQSVQKQVKKEISDLFNKTKGTKEELHAVYYCINGNSSRIESLELDLITELSKQLPVLVVLTQSIGQPAVEFKTYIEELNLPVAGVLNVMAEPYPVSEEYTIPASGLKELIERTFSVIPEDAKKAFNNAQQADIARKARAARRWATRYIVTTFGVGFIPIPFSDASLLVPMQVTLLAHITAIFGISLDKASIVSMVAAVGGTSGTTFLGRSMVANVIKFIPGAGTLAGGIISGTTAAMLTSALAMSYIEVLTLIANGEKEGKYPDLSKLETLMRERFETKLKVRSKKKTLKGVTKVEDQEMSELEQFLTKDTKRSNGKMAVLQRAAKKVLDKCLNK
ncbi:YcjF family protein [Atopococcus tabaci]|uniref:YcjF family protein n=1 Tax=Atopococcus tabaci TaxID=269774 RepID=UPI00240A94C7|nr:GTPase [Atopococcus tabaci]